MSQASKRQGALVGLFVLIALLVLGAGVFTVGSASSAFTRKVVVHATFDDVGGLQVGSNIWYAGVKVGTVKRISFSEDARVVVDLGIERKSSPFLRDDVVAKIGTDGLIGNKIVTLTDPVSPDGEALARSPLGSLEAGEALASGASLSPEVLMATFQKTNEKLLTVASDVEAITGRVNRGEGTVGRLLHEDALYTDLSETVATMGAASANAEAMTLNFASFSAKLDSKDTLPGQLVNDHVTYAKLTDGVGKLHTVAAKADSVVAGLDAATRNPATPIGTLLHDEETAGDLKETLANLSTGTQLLEEDLEAVQHNFLLRGYFRKQEKERKKAEARGEVPVAPATQPAAAPEAETEPKPEAVRPPEG